MFATLAPILLQATLETFAMVISALALGTAFGLPLGVLLATSGRGELFEAPLFQKSIGPIVNATRSVPFIILAVAIIPFTRLIVGTSIGTSAAIVPLTVAAIPFIARIIEGAIREVDGGLVEAAQAMGARPFQVVTKVLLPEALPGIIHGLTLTAVTLIGYSAMVGAVGAGGLGDLGIRYGYQRFRPDVMAAVVITLIVVVQMVQSLGDWMARKADKRNI
ncbi:D-methionine transport system permease protein [Thalassospira sp. MBR-102]|jgi:D-methionine transport system permease protein|uniref:DL-methionine transporter permease subunit n=2 Tax=Thalassospira xiamenensis TaxID=220697 RepID=A0ABR5Y0D3_9PROT|nr:MULTISPECIES: methionine ABC transporter permease [Thalassospira]MBR9779237.1 ABC transporter permease [Rhodospirillales bacterium]AJD51390.1 binding-protein dependent transport system inner membrane protein [Thalassospira xiamenensis M-5 = DSM 17429]KZD02982.1 DL-methionine transporter permease subunit [Thalassospira xiamenensis]KZD08476.1 DL-methionine transporter permease subunit [Thalassospira xiamenensis]MAB34931.1 ABC transporter permease [Thalassospira sp.]|tara:strand:+ start:869 stop:1528 length:660 start_codon:yes stop_codon:yes gene_type:complete